MLLTSDTLAQYKPYLYDIQPWLLIAQLYLNQLKQNYEIANDLSAIDESFGLDRLPLDDPNNFKYINAYEDFKLKRLDVVNKIYNNESPASYMKDIIKLRQQSLWLKNVNAALKARESAIASSQNDSHQYIYIQNPNTTTIDDWMNGSLNMAKISKLVLYEQGLKIGAAMGQREYNQTEALINAIARTYGYDTSYGLTNDQVQQMINNGEMDKFVNQIAKANNVDQIIDDKDKALAKEIILNGILAGIKYKQTHKDVKIPSLSSSKEKQSKEKVSIYSNSGNTNSTNTGNGSNPDRSSSSSGSDGSNNRGNSGSTTSTSSSSGGGKPPKNGGTPTVSLRVRKTSAEGGNLYTEGDFLKDVNANDIFSRLAKAYIDELHFKDEEDVRDYFTNQHPEDFKYLEADINNFLLDKTDGKGYNILEYLNKIGNFMNTMNRVQGVGGISDKVKNSLAELLISGNFGESNNIIGSLKSSKLIPDEYNRLVNDYNNIIDYWNKLEPYRNKFNEIVREFTPIKQRINQFGYNTYDAFANDYTLIDQQKTNDIAARLEFDKGEFNEFDKLVKLEQRGKLSQYGKSRLENYRARLKQAVAKFNKFITESGTIDSTHRNLNGISNSKEREIINNIKEKVKGIRSDFDEYSSIFSGSNDRMFEQGAASGLTYLLTPNLGQDEIKLAQLIARIDDYNLNFITDQNAKPSVTNLLTAGKKEDSSGLANEFSEADLSIFGGPNVATTHSVRMKPDFKGALAPFRKSPKNREATLDPTYIMEDLPLLSENLSKDEIKTFFKYNEKGKDASNKNNYNSNILRTPNQVHNYLIYNILEKISKAKGGDISKFDQKKLNEIYDDIWVASLRYALLYSYLKEMKIMKNGKIRELDAVGAMNKLIHAEGIEDGVLGQIGLGTMKLEAVQMDNEKIDKANSQRYDAAVEHVKQLLISEMNTDGAGKISSGIWIVDVPDSGAAFKASRFGSRALDSNIINPYIRVDGDTKDDLGKLFKEEKNNSRFDNLRDTFKFDHGENKSNVMGTICFVPSLDRIRVQFQYKSTPVHLYVPIEEFVGDKTTRDKIEEFVKSYHTFKRLAMQDPGSRTNYIGQAWKCLSVAIRAIRAYCGNMVLPQKATDSSTTLTDEDWAVILGVSPLGAEKQLQSTSEGTE